MPIYPGIPYQPYDFLIKKLDGLVVAQDSRGRVRFSGSDAATVMQKAIDALPAGLIHIAAGTYEITNPIAIKKNNIILQGSGWGTILKLADNANCDVIQAGATPGSDDTNIYKGVIIRDFAVDANQANNTGPRFGIRFTNCQWCKAVNNFVYDTRETGIAFEGTAGMIPRQNWVLYNRIRNTLYDGVGAYGSHHFIIGNWIELVTYAGVYLVNGNWGLIAHNWINYAGYFGIWLRNHSNARAIGNRIIDSYRDNINIRGSYNIISCNNLQAASRAGSGQYNEILLDEEDTVYSRYNIISQNRVYSTRADCGCKETSGNEDYNLIHGNMFLGTYVTGAVSLSGLNSISADNIT